MGLYNPIQRLFGKKVDHADTPADNEVMTFDAATDDWGTEASGAGESNTSSNAGTGDGWALAKSGSDLPFKSLITTSPLATSVNANDLTLTLATLNIGTEVATTLTETQDIWIGAEAMVGTTTNGAAFASRELPTNDIMISTMAFDTTTSEKSQFTWTPPNNWNAGTIKMTLYWTNASGLTTETIDFDCAGVAFANDNPLDAAMGTAISVTDTWIAQNDLHVSAQSGAITIAGSPTAGEMVIFQLSRDTASDDMTGDVEIIGVLLEYTINDIGTT